MSFHSLSLIFSLHVDNYGNVSQFHAAKTFLLHNFYVPAHTYFYAQGECLLPATSTDDVKGMSSFNDLKTVEE